MRALLLGILLLPLLPQVPFMQGPEGVLNPGYWERSPLPQMGLATYYARGMMEYVVDYRTGRGQLPRCDECVGAIALLRAGDIGRKVWLQPPGGELAGPFLVVDCARRDDVPALVGANWAVDVSYEVGQQWAMTGPLADVIVWPDPEDPAAPESLLSPQIDPSDVRITPPTPTGQTPRSALPTRLPGPRGTTVVTAPGGPEPGSVSAGAVTTPTSNGRVPATPNQREAGLDGTIPAGPDDQVALGRPGVELLLLAARPASFLVDPTVPPITADLSPTVTPRPPKAAAIEMDPILPIVTHTPMVRASAPPRRHLLQELWHFLRSLLTRHQAWPVGQPIP